MRIAILALAALLAGGAGPGAAQAVGSEPVRAAAASTAIVPGAVDRTSLLLTATYDVTASLRTATGRLWVSAEIDVRNESGGPIDRVELNLVPLRLGAYRQREVLVDGRPVVVRRSDQTLSVPLGGVLPAAATVHLRVRYDAAFSTSLAGSSWMFSRAGGMYTAYRWIPWISRPVAFDRPNFGDPFVTPSSPSVVLRITTDRPLVFATSGRQTALSGLTRTFVAQDVRDLNFVAGYGLTALASRQGDTTVRVVGPASTRLTTLLAEAKRALAALESRLGTYPYPTFNVVSTPGGWGMESPALIWIPRPTPSANLRYLVTHETAHQWFYALVGNDQASEPFADEAAADFVTRNLLGMRRASRCATGRLDRTIYSYSAACYYEILYIQGGNELDDLRRLIGDAAFWGAIRAHIAANRFGLTGTRALLLRIDGATPRDLVPRFHARFPRYF